MLYVMHFGSDSTFAVDGTHQFGASASIIRIHIDGQSPILTNRQFPGRSFV